MDMNTKLSTEQEAITDVMGMAVLLCNILTAADAVALVNICIQPISEEAMPVLVWNGANDKAEVLGNKNPCIAK